jgi:hypothetical protein
MANMSIKCFVSGDMYVKPVPNNKKIPPSYPPEKSKHQELSFEELLTLLDAVKKMNAN